MGLLFNFVIYQNKATINKEKKMLNIIFEYSDKIKKSKKRIMSDFVCESGALIYKNIPEFIALLGKIESYHLAYKKRSYVDPNKELRLFVVECGSGVKCFVQSIVDIQAERIQMRELCCNKDARFDPGVKNVNTSISFSFMRDATRKSQAEVMVFDRTFSVLPMGFTTEQDVKAGRRYSFVVACTGRDENNTETTSYYLRNQIFAMSQSKWEFVNLHKPEHYNAYTKNILLSSKEIAEDFNLRESDNLHVYKYENHKHSQNHLDPLMLVTAGHSRDPFKTEKIINLKEHEISDETKFKLNDLYCENLSLLETPLKEFVVEKASVK